MEKVTQIVQQARSEFRNLLERMVADGGLTEERYVRFLSMQYHLTRGVQRHFMIAASHPDFAGKKSFRNFLIQFANEEELHFLIAQRDLKALGYDPLSPNLDTQLWWAYFNNVVTERPLVRLGATCILENISGSSSDLIQSLLQSSKFLTPKNTRFLVIHQHEELPHGDQIIEALTNAKFRSDQIADLQEGAQTGSTLYLRMFSWVVNGYDVRAAA